MSKIISRCVIIFVCLDVRYYSLGLPMSNISTPASLLADIGNKCANPFVSSVIKTKLNECNITGKGMTHYDEKLLLCLMFYDINHQICNSSTAIIAMDAYNKTVLDVQDITKICDTASEWHFSPITRYPKYASLITESIHHKISCLRVCAEDDITSLNSNFFCKYYNWGTNIMKVPQISTVINEKKSITDIPKNLTNESKEPLSPNLNNIPKIDETISDPSSIQVSSTDNLKNKPGKFDGVSQDGIKKEKEPETAQNGPETIQKELEAVQKEPQTVHQEPEIVERKPETVESKPETGGKKPETVEKALQSAPVGDVLNNIPLDKSFPPPDQHISKDDEAIMDRPDLDNLEQQNLPSDSKKIKPQDELNDYDNGDDLDEDKEALDEGPDPNLDSINDKIKETQNLNKIIEPPLSSSDIAHKEMSAQDGFSDDDHFFPFFLTGIILIVLLYILYHNKSKVSKVVLGLIVEGRQSGRRRNSRGHAYRRLDTLEQAMSSNTAAPPSKIIY